MSSSNKTSSLPIDLVEDILYKTPLKSLLRFKSISKEWYALINNKRFIYKLSSASHKQFMRADSKTIKLFNLETQAQLSRPILDTLPCYQYRKTIHCDGLLLCICTKKLAVFNPFLNRVKWIKPYKSCDVYGFGYDNVSRDNYKILRFNIGTWKKPDVEIYEFRSKLWRCVDATPIECDKCCLALPMKGNMYWVVSKMKIVDHYEIIGFFIQCFDFSTETFKTICPVPNGMDFYMAARINRFVFSGFEGDKLSLLHQNYDRGIEVWFTNKVSDVIVSWSKFFNVDIIGLPLTQSFHLQSFSTFYIHKTNKITMWRLVVNEKKKIHTYANVNEILGEGEINKQVEMTILYRSHSCNVYVPSLVPVPE